MRFYKFLKPKSGNFTFQACFDQKLVRKLKRTSDFFDA